MKERTKTLDLTVDHFPLNFVNIYELECCPIINLAHINPLIYSFLRAMTISNPEAY